MNVLVLHGPDLRFWAHTALTPAELDSELRRFARTLKLVLQIHRSNHEGVLLDVLWLRRRWASGVLIAPGPLARQSHALAEGLSSLGVPVVEVQPALSDEAQASASLFEAAGAHRVVGGGSSCFERGLRELHRRVLPAPRHDGRRLKTLGRARARPSPRRAPGQPPTRDRDHVRVLTRAEVREQIAAHLRGQRSATELAEWARRHFLAIERGAQVEDGASAVVADALTALIQSGSPRNALSEDELIGWMARLSS